MPIFIYEDKLKEVRKMGREIKVKILNAKGEIITELLLDLETDKMTIQYGDEKILRESYRQAVVEIAKWQLKKGLYNENNNEMLMNYILVDKRAFEVENGNYYWPIPTPIAIEQIYGIER